MKEMLELRPNKKLLDTNFSGYKLSLDSIPVYRHTVEKGEYIFYETNFCIMKRL